MSLAHLPGPLMAAGRPLPGTNENLRGSARPTAKAMKPGLVRHHLLAGGGVLEGAILSALMDGAGETRPSNLGQLRAQLKRMKSDSGMPRRITMKLAVAKPTQGATLGERVDAGLPRPGAGRSRASSPQAATARAPREILIVLCNDAKGEQEALQSIRSQVEAARTTRQQASFRIQDEARSFTAVIRRAGTPGGRQWSWVSGNALL